MIFYKGFFYLTKSDKDKDKDEQIDIQNRVFFGNLKIYKC